MSAVSGWLLCAHSSFSSHQGFLLLLAVLANPPLTDGSMTRKRVEALARILGEPTVTIENVFPVATSRSGDISTIGADPQVWLDHRQQLAQHLATSRKVLLGYGIQEPSGPARLHHRAQIAWLCRELLAARLTPIEIGDGPRHPSRWNRHTYRNHPGIAFESAIALSIRSVTVEELELRAGRG